MKLSYIHLCGFRGFCKPIRIDFSQDFTIIDGRNGVGKSTIFDAIEFVLTGRLSKYGDAKADRESADDYVWWVGAHASPKDQFVEVGFIDSQNEISVRRSPLDTDDDSLLAITARLCDLRAAPTASIAQLCATSIIRDERITSLSLDMRETERYALLRDALGAADAEKWIDRAAKLLSAVRKKSAQSEQEINQANQQLSSALRNLDEARAALASNETISKATEFLQNFTGLAVPADQLEKPAREKVSKARGDISEMLWLINEWPHAIEERERVEKFTAAVSEAKKEVQKLDDALKRLPKVDHQSALLSEARTKSQDIMQLASLGKRLGLQNSQCPLCTKHQSADEFNKGILKIEARAKELDDDVAQIVEQINAITDAERMLSAAKTSLAQKTELLIASKSFLDLFEQRRLKFALPLDSSNQALLYRLDGLRREVEEAELHLRAIETLRSNRRLELASQSEQTAKQNLARIQERFARARKVETQASSLHDAVRRAAAETLDRRLERVLPLMAELYRRLRPHPVWEDIEYSIRGDVQRFLKLKVGDGLNPQFMFSSGQRRATGLAFLLSVNLSLAWSRWKSILLDDPVQHIDDFRSVQLAEVLAQLLVEGRQIICSVEDPALADLLGRRLLIKKSTSGKRITLGTNSDGALAIIGQKVSTPLVQRALTLQGHRAAS